MASTIAKRAAQKIQTQEAELEEIKEENEALRERLEVFEKRAKAEEILKQAREADEAPSKLKPATVDDFLHKRADLAERQDMDKVASLVEFCGDGKVGELSDLDDDNAPQDFTSFLSKHK